MDFDFVGLIFEVANAVVKGDDLVAHLDLKTLDFILLIVQLLLRSLKLLWRVN